MKKIYSVFLAFSILLGVSPFRVCAIDPGRNVSDGPGIQTFMVSFDATGGEIDPAEAPYLTYYFELPHKIVEDGEFCGVLPVPRKANCEFLGWFTEEDGGIKISSDRLICWNQTFFAHWSQLSFTVSFQPNGGEGHCASIEVKNGEPYGALPTLSRAGFRFDGWYTSLNGGERVTEYSIVNLTGDQTLYARWSQLSFTVSFQPNGGEGHCASIEVKNGEPYGALPTLSRAGFRFDGWYTSLNGGEHITEYSIVNLTSDQTLYAHWSQLSFTVSFQPNGGEGHCANIEVKNGEPYGALPTLSRAGFRFDGWYTSLYGGERITEYSIVNLTGDQTLYARWSEVETRNIFNPKEEGFSFHNSSYDLGLPQGYVIPVELWIEVYGEQMGRALFDRYGREAWAGSCFGFSVASEKFYNGNLRTSDYGAEDTYHIPTPKNANSTITRLINKCQISWFLNGVGNVLFDRNSLIHACKNFYETGTNPIIFYVDGYAGTFRYCHAVVPWKIEQAGQDYRIYVYDNNLPGDESIFYIAHSEGGYSCNYQYGHNPITVNRLGMQYLQWVLDGERSVSKGNAIYNKYMFVSVNSPDAEITTSSGISTDQIDGAIRIEQIPLDGTITSYTDYWLPYGEYEISSRSSHDVSILVSDENETYTLTIIPENKNTTVKIGTRIMPGSIAHGNIMTYSEDGGTQLLPAVLNEDGELLLPGTNFIPASYSDMHDTTAWYHEPIMSVSAVGLVNGIGTNYEPNSTLTVGMLITILMRIEHGILPLGETWYDTNINAAIQDGILQTTDGLEPMQQVTRGQAALLLSRFIEHFNSGWAKNRVEDSPSDISTVPAQYRDSVEKVYHWNLIHGDEQGRFNSESYLTRAEIAQIIYNYYSIVD